MGNDGIVGWMRSTHVTGRRTSDDAAQLDRAEANQKAAPDIRGRFFSA